jgi:hypothetical protein
MADKPRVDENTLRTMQELLRQPPKLHSEMKLRKRDRKLLRKVKSDPNKLTEMARAIGQFLEHDED